MKNDLDGLDELSIVYLAMGLIECPAMPRLSEERLLKLSRTQAIHDAAKEIVLRELHKIANRQIGADKDADPFLQEASCAYAYRKLNGRGKGRPDDYAQRDAIRNAYQMLTLYNGKPRLDGKRNWKHESVIKELCARFKLSRSQIEKVLQRTMKEAEGS
jgi:hypothetical protein